MNGFEFFIVGLFIQLDVCWKFVVIVCYNSVVCFCFGLLIWGVYVALFTFV